MKTFVINWKQILFLALFKWVVTRGGIGRMEKEMWVKKERAFL